MAGSLKNNRQNLALNLTLGTKGCTGTMGTKGQGSVILLKIGKTLWIKPGAKASSLASVGALCDPNQFAHAFASNLTGMVKGADTTISGQPALQIKDSADPASVYVTVSARPEFLRLAGGGTNGQLDFTKYNAPLHLTPPPSAQVLDGAQYGF